MSLPPPSSAPPPGEPDPTADDGVEAPPKRRITLPLASPRGLRKLTSGPGDRHIELFGRSVTIEHPGVLNRPITFAGGLVDVAAVDRGSSDSTHGRFPILHRLSDGRVIPQEHGIQGWLWTTRHGSAIPLLSETDDDQPNLALLFVKPLADDDVEQWFRPEWLRALADRSPLGKPTVPGLLLAVEHAGNAESAFRSFGVLADLTDREVPPTHRRHLPGDKPASSPIDPVDALRQATSIAPPGFK